MEPAKELGEAIYRTKVEKARRMGFDEKLWGGSELFREVCDRMRAGILWQFPASTPEEVEQQLVRRLNRLRQVEEAACKKTNTSLA